MKRSIGLMLLLGALLACPLLATAETGEPANTEERHVLNFDDVELNALVADISVVTGYTFIVHPDVRSKRVTVTSAAPLSRAEVFEVFLSTLRVHGFTAVPAGRDTYRIIPEKSAVGDAAISGAGGNAFVTEIIRLTHINAMEAAQMVKPLVDAEGQVVANARSNTLVVVDYASNLPRIRELIDELDEDTSATETVALNNIPAAELQSILSSLNASSGEGGYASPLTAVASASGNAIVLRGDANAVARARAVAERLDASDRSDDTLRIIALNNASGEELVPILEQVALAMQARRGALADQASPSTIAHHPSTNSLVISAPSETLAALERVIENLDGRRAQVLVEALIVEMSDDTARELGLQFLVAGTGDSAVPFASTNYSRSAPNLLALAGAVTADDGLSGQGGGFGQGAVNSLLGLTGATLGIGGQSGDTLFGAILNAVENDTNSRILSKPFNLTLDNGKSSLLVGQEVPISTGQVLGGDFANTFQTTDRKEIGIRLDVVPRISDDDTVQLTIVQEVSNIAGVVGEATPDLIFNKRAIETEVLADNGEIIVLGGLIEQTDTETLEKVPGLGDLPVAGRLFRSEGRGQTRTNLMVFIKPTIIRDADGARGATSRSYRYLQAEALWRGDTDGVGSLDAFVTDVLGSPPPQ